MALFLICSCSSSCCWCPCSCSCSCCCSCSCSRSCCCCCPPPPPPPSSSCRRHLVVVSCLCCCWRRRPHPQICFKSKYTPNLGYNILRTSQNLNSNEASSLLRQPQISNAIFQAVELARVIQCIKAHSDSDERHPSFTREPETAGCVLLTR